MTPEDFDAFKAELAEQGFEVVGQPLSYQGKEGCRDWNCRQMHIGGEYPGHCYGYHCTVCDKPSSMYGHNDCQRVAEEIDEAEHP